MEKSYFWKILPYIFLLVNVLQCDNEALMKKRWWPSQVTVNRISYNAATTPFTYHSCTKTRRKHQTKPSPTLLPHYKHLCSNIFPDLFLDKNPKIAIWFIFLCTTCFDHQALFTCCYWLDSFDSWLTKSKSEACIKTQTDTKICEKSESDD